MTSEQLELFMRLVADRMAWHHCMDSIYLYQEAPGLRPVAQVWRRPKHGWYALRYGEKVTGPYRELEQAQRAVEAS